MADVAPEFEISDKAGQTFHHNGTATTSAVSIPASPAGVIDYVLIDNRGNNTIEVSFDSGGNWKKIDKLGVLTWLVKGNVNQIRIRSVSGTSAYEILMNREPV